MPCSEKGIRPGTNPELPIENSLSTRDIWLLVEQFQIYRH